MHLLSNYSEVGLSMSKVCWPKGDAWNGWFPFSLAGRTGRPKPPPAGYLGNSSLSLPTNIPTRRERESKGVKQLQDLCVDQHANCNTVPSNMMNYHAARPDPRTHRTPQLPDPRPALGPSGLLDFVPLGPWKPLATLGDHWRHA